MLHWLHSLLPHVPRFGYVFVFVVVLLNNIGAPLPGETIMLGAGFLLGQTAAPLWPPILAGTAGCFLGGIGSFWLGRRLEQGGLEKIRWLHLTAKRLEWPERFFRRHGPRAVFIARFIALFPPIIVNVLAGMSKMPWRTFLPYNLTGSAAYTVTYILIGYFFGNQWRFLTAWLGANTLYEILAGTVLVILGLIFRGPLSLLWARFSGKT